MATCSDRIAGKNTIVAGAHATAYWARKHGAARVPRALAEELRDEQVDVFG